MSWSYSFKIVQLQASAGKSRMFPVIFQDSFQIRKLIGPGGRHDLRAKVAVAPRAEHLWRNIWSPHLPHSWCDRLHLRRGGNEGEMQSICSKDKMEVLSTNKRQFCIWKVTPLMDIGYRSWILVRHLDLDRQGSDGGDGPLYNKQAHPQSRSRLQCRAFLWPKSSIIGQ